MAYTRRYKVNPYPYRGAFYSETMDYSVPLDQREMGKTLLYETECDIQEVSKAANPTLIATFSIFFPFNPEDKIPFTRGVHFEGKMGSLDVSGVVTNVVLSQLGGIVAYVKDYDSEGV